MDHEKTPSTVMFAELKALGISNHDAAHILLDTSRPLGSSTVRERIESRTQLSRRIVHVAPGELDADLFCDYAQSVTVMLERFGVTWRRRFRGEMMQTINERLTGRTAQAMQRALHAFGADADVYRNALARIAGLQLRNEANLAKLHLLLFVVTGCTGDPAEGARLAERYAAENLESTFVTPRAEVEFTEDTAPVPMALGLIRMVSGHLKGADSLYNVAADEAGTEIGAFASSAGAITDVDPDVSRYHARVYRKDGRWYVIGLRSLNGTVVIGGDDKQVHVVEPPRWSRAADYVPQPYEIFPADTLCFGATTRYLVVPVS